MKTFEDTGYKTDANGKFLAIIDDGWGVFYKDNEMAPFKEWAHAMTWINFKLKENHALKWQMKWQIRFVSDMLNSAPALPWRSTDPRPPW